MNLFTYNEKINDDYLIIDEVCKNLVFVDENIIKAKFNKKNKKLIIYLANKCTNYKKNLLNSKIKFFLKKSYSKYKIPKSEILLNKIKNNNFYPRLQKVDPGKHFKPKLAD